MPRPKTVSQGLPARVSVRRLSTGILYYYCCRDGRRIPLGKDPKEATRIALSINQHAGGWPKGLRQYLRERDRLQLAADDHALSQRTRDGNYRLLTVAEIVARSVSAEKTSGVYFLIQHAGIVYVGSSTNIHKRVTADHKVRGLQFDRYSWIECEVLRMRSLEAAYIAALKPPLNRHFVREY